MGPGRRNVSLNQSVLSQFPISIYLLYRKVTLSVSEGLTSEPGFANTVIAVDAILADTIVTWVAGAVIEVYLTVCT